MIVERKRAYILHFVFYAFVFVLLYAMNKMVSPVLDDWYFIHRARDSSLLDFLRMYYREGNGRLISNALAHLLFNQHFELWRILNTGMFMLCAWCLARIFKKRVSAADYLLSLSLLFLLSSLIAREAFFWATGSLNYLWPITCALLTMIPFADSLFREENPKPRTQWLFFFPAVYAGIGNEQVGLCTLGFMACYSIFSLHRKKKIHPLLLLLSLASLLAFLLLVLSPSTSNRYQSEINSAFPNFLELTLWQHIVLTFRWVSQRLFVELGIYVFLSFFLALVVYQENHNIVPFGKKKVTFSIFVLLLTIAVSSLLLRDYRHEVFTSIQQFAGSTLNKLVLAIPHVFWPVFACAWGILVYRAKPLYALFALAGLCSLFMMGFSPTIYASGYRTAAVTAIMLCVILQHMMTHSKVRSVLLVCVPSAALVNLIYILLDNFAWFQRM